MTGRHHPAPRALHSLCAVALLLASAPGCAAKDASPPPALPLHGWQLLAPLPDPVGYGGMFAGVLNGRLVTGGGSHFHDKPNWLQGEKRFSDRIFTLADPGAQWSEHASRLPTKLGHFATAATPDAIYLVGGINTGGCQTQAWEMRADGDGFRFNPLPDYPHLIGYAVAAIANDRLYVIGGLPEPTSKSPGVETWSLALADSPERRWRREPDVPGPGVFVCAAASDGTAVYLFGGIGFTAEGKATPSARACRLAAGAKQWERLADLPEPRVGAATPCPLVNGKKFFVIGGYAEVFPGAPREHPGFNTQTFFYDIASNTWQNGPVLPRAPVPNRDSPGDVGPAPMIAAPSAVWRDHVVVISGEVRASVRTPTVIAWPLTR